jgi:hypothetical protein
MDVSAAAQIRTYGVEAENIEKGHAAEHDEACAEQDG